MFKRPALLILFLLIALPLWPRTDVFAAACSSSSAVTFSFVPSTNTFPSGSAADIVVKLNTGADDCNIAFISIDARIDAALSTYASFPAAFFSPNPAISNLGWTLGAVTSGGQHVSFIALRPSNPGYIVNGDLTLGTLHIMTNTPGANFNLAFDSSTEVATTLPGSGVGGDLPRNLPSGQYTISSAASPSPSPTGCICQSDNTCSSECQFIRLAGQNYNDPIKCSLDANLFRSIPTQADKNAWCNRSTRTTGNAEGDNTDVQANDYLYYLRALNNGTIPTGVNPDFNGDGAVNTFDLLIWQGGKGR